MHHNISTHGNHEKFAAQVRSRTTNDGAVIENPLGMVLIPSWQ